MLKRTVTQKLLEWKENPQKKALLIDGARQIGKTFIIREFAKEHYTHFVELNFLLQPQSRLIFEKGGTAAEIITGITAFSGASLVPGKTLIFLDEIQECPMARMAVKTLVQDGRFDYIESGSLLGIQYKEVPSYPVGYEEELTMYPMGFEEFCSANGVGDETLSYLKDCFACETPVLDAVHEKMLKLFGYYMIVGGLPAAVQEFVNSHDIGRVVKIQKDILALYREDIAKYSKNDKPRIKQIFDSIPAELNKHNLRFMLSDLDKNARGNRYESSFLWLSDAGVTLPCYNLGAPLIPFRINERRNLFRLFLCDTGLLCAMCMENVQFEILKENLEVNMGSIVENCAAQIFAANGFSLHYFDRKNFGELDFVLQDGSRVLPVELKSGADYKRHPALDHTLAQSEWNIKKGFVFCRGNIAQDGGITYFPLYMLMFMKAVSVTGTLIVPGIAF